MDEPNLFLQTLQLNGQGGARPIEEGATGTEQEPLWWHIDYSHPDAVDWLRGQNLPPSVLEAMTQAETRPRVMRFPEGVLIALRGVNLTPGADPEDMVSVRLWLQPDRIISARKRRLMSVQDVANSLSEGIGPRTIGEFLVSLVTRLAERIGDAVDEIEARTEALESVESNDRVQRREITGLRRETAAIRRFLAPQRDALNALYGLPNLSREEAFALQHQSDRMTRFVEDLELAREQALVLQEELANRIAQEQNARTYLLSIVATIFLPLSFLTGVFGMNVAGLPGVEDPNGFVAVAWVMVALAVALILVMRWKRWL